MSGIRDLKKQLSDTDPALNRAQDKMAEFVKPFVNSPIIDGRLVKDVVLIAGTPTNVNHGLGREIIGWFLAGNSANSVVWDLQASNPLKKQLLKLQASANTTVTLWVF
jgi:hypothetical protein